ncbi:hypothetical protein RRG08_007837 [Elysia crispata]|uniref:Uncharacterized protein n=1 Tax=Elysia crispata TaxID=231223 RepID=A0AAE0XW26_9GAST|nr:hypothetical protein RRG08_007837 [Elysia crispata]
MGFGTGVCCCGITAAVRSPLYNIAHPYGFIKLKTVEWLSKSEDSKGQALAIHSSEYISCDAPHLRRSRLKTFRQYGKKHTTNQPNLIRPRSATTFYFINFPLSVSIELSPKAHFSNVHIGTTISRCGRKDKNGGKQPLMEAARGDLSIQKPQSRMLHYFKVGESPSPVCHCTVAFNEYSSTVDF